VYSVFLAYFYYHFKALLLKIDLFFMINLYFYSKISRYVLLKPLRRKTNFRVGIFTSFIFLLCECRIWIDLDEKKHVLLTDIIALLFLGDYIAFAISI
jgi:hypothetical protein